MLSLVPGLILAYGADIRQIALMILQSSRVQMFSVDGQQEQRFP
jgi:uncharacterized spore protein YtfJ